MSALRTVLVAGFVVGLAACATGRMHDSQQAPHRAPAADMPSAVPMLPTTQPARPTRVDHARGPLNASFG